MNNTRDGHAYYCRKCQIYASNHGKSWNKPKTLKLSALEKIYGIPLGPWELKQIRESRMKVF